MHIYAYLWLPPHVRPDREQELRHLRGASLEAYCRSQEALWQGLEVDRSLNLDPLKRPVLKRLLKTLKSEDLLVVQTLLDLGRRFHDAHSLLRLFRDSETRGSLLALDEGLRVDRHAGSELLMVLSTIPQLQVPSEAEAAVPACRRSELSRQNGGACPYGYRINPENNEYELVPAEAKVVRQIFKLRARGQSLRQIVQKLTHDKIQTKRGGRWHANTIKAILENPFYTGAYQTHFASFENNHPEIISQALFYELNAHLLCDDIAL